jgi:hypothetical protein
MKSLLAAILLIAPSACAQDIERGRVDTDRRGIPNDVPKGKPT